MQAHGCEAHGCQQQGEAFSPGGDPPVEQKGGEPAQEVRVLGPLEQSTMDKGFDNRKSGGSFLLGRMSRASLQLLVAALTCRP